MCKFIKIIAFILTMLFVMGAEPEYYVNKVKGMPISSTKRLGGVWERAYPKCSHKIKPIDTFKEKMTIEAYNKVSIGTGIFVVALIISIAFANPLTHTITNIVMGIGGTWALLGFIKLFVATYVIYFSIGAIILILITIVFRLKGRSVLNIGKWFKEFKSIKK